MLGGEAAHAAAVLTTGKDTPVVVDAPDRRLVDPFGLGDDRPSSLTRAISRPVDRLTGQVADHRRVAEMLSAGQRHLRADERLSVLDDLRRPSG